MSADPDDYERKYMAGARALASSRVRMPRWFFALMAGIALITVASGIATLVATRSLAGLVPLLVSLPLVAFMTLLFSHMRLALTPSEVVVQYGLFGPKIQLARIHHVAAEHYDWKKFGGWGIKASRDGTTAYSVPGGDGGVVRVHWTDETGKERKIVVSVEDAAGMAAAIERARTAATAERARIARVTAPPNSVPPARASDAGAASQGDPGHRRRDAPERAARRKRPDPRAPRGRG